jgi:FtsZ-binding cell division protein ZapB
MLTVLSNLTNSSSQHASGKGGASGLSDENAAVNLASVQGMSLAELQKEVIESREKIKAITQKFATVRKERDTVKQENKDLQEEVLTLQSSIRQMVPCFSNTSSAFPMQNEMSNIVAKFYKCDC